MNQINATAIGLFNYAHTYAQSAVTLQEHQTDATHWNAPVYFLYFHAIELYLKAYLVGQGEDLEVLRKKYGHKVRPLADLAKNYGLTFGTNVEAVFDLMDQTDNVITARYLRIGTHTRLPFSSFFDTCDTLHDQIMAVVYRGVQPGRRPVLREAGSD